MRSTLASGSTRLAVSRVATLTNRGVERAPVSGSPRPGVGRLGWPVAGRPPRLLKLSPDAAHLTAEVAALARQPRLEPAGRERDSGGALHEVPVSYRRHRSRPLAAQELHPRSAKRCA